MLKGIPSILSPELLKILMEMGHGDTLVIADGNFPSARCAKRLIRLDGHNIPEILESILKLLPLDTYCETPVSLMKVLPNDPYIPTIWNTYEEVIKLNFDKFSKFNFIDRDDFYKEAENAFVVIATSEKALYANMLLTKGVL